MDLAEQRERQTNMKLWVACACLVVTACGTGPTDLPSPLCQRPEVLEDAARLIRTADLYAVLDETAVEESPGTLAGIVNCRVGTLSAGYVQIAGRWERRPILRDRRYTVSLAQNRFSVRLAP